MTTIEMEYAISRRFDVRTHTIVPNVSWGLLSHEADVLVMRETGFLLEFEIKRSFSDYKADFKKHKWRNGLSKTIKKFYYCFPADLWRKRRGHIQEILPEFAGILVIYKNGERLPFSEIIKPAKLNPGCKALSKPQQLKLAQLGTMRIWNLKRQIITSQNDKKRLNQSSRGSK